MPDAKHKAAMAAWRLAEATKKNKATYLDEIAKARDMLMRLPSLRSARDTTLRGLRSNMARQGLTGGAALMMEQQVNQDMADQAARYNMEVGRGMADLAGQKFNVAQGADSQVEGTWLNLFQQRAAQDEADQQAKAAARANLMGSIGGLATDAAMAYFTGGASVPYSLSKYTGGRSGGVGGSARFQVR